MAMPVTVQCPVLVTTNVNVNTILAVNSVTPAVQCTIKEDGPLENLYQVMIYKTVHDLDLFNVFFQAMNVNDVSVMDMQQNVTLIHKLNLNGRARILQENIQVVVSAYNAGIILMVLTVKNVYQVDQL